MSKINVSDKTRLKNGDEYLIIENNFLNVDSKDNVGVKINNNSGFRIKIETFRKPISTVTIFLTNGNDYVGHISANLYDNSTASLIMSGVRDIKLPNELSKYCNIIEKHDTALLVDKKYRRQGKATQLIMLMFQYLNEKGITDLEIDGITDDIAMQTYLNTGAEVIGVKKAIYRNISRFLQKEEHKDFER